MASEAKREALLIPGIGRDTATLIMLGVTPIALLMLFYPLPLSLSHSPSFFSLDFSSALY